MHETQRNTDDQQERRLYLLGQVTTQVAHDLGSLLTGAAGNLDLALEDIPADHPSHELLCLSRRLMGEISDLRAWLLAFARGGPPRAQLLDLGALIGQSMPILARLIEHRIRIVTTLAVKCYVVADPSALERVLLNLLLNARDAIAEEGTIEIVVRRRAGCVVLAVADTGCGMSPATLNRIGIPYATTKRGGTGLGLVACQQLLEAHGGGIEIASTVGAGTTVTVLLPAI